MARGGRPAHAFPFCQPTSDSCLVSRPYSMHAGKDRPGRCTQRRRSKPVQPARSGAESWGQAKLKLAVKRSFGGGLAVPERPLAKQLPVPPLPDVGMRVEHPSRGSGVIAEHMEDGRTRIDFDSGESHRHAAPRPFARAISGLRVALTPGVPSALHLAGTIRAHCTGSWDATACRAGRRRGSVHRDQRRAQRARQSRSRVRAPTTPHSLPSRLEERKTEAQIK